VIEITDWFSATRFPERPWLVIGKGPTFSLRAQVDIDRYNTFGLNHVVGALEVDVAHVIDIDVVEACGHHLLENCRWVLMPRVPHVQQSPSRLPLEDFVKVLPVLDQLDRQGRLVWYNAETSPPVGSSPVMEVRYFSSEAAFSILGEMGVREIFTLGIDGGASYSPTFDPVASATRLANGQPTFDIQFAELDRIARRHGIHYEPVIEPIRVYVGADESQLVALRVLEHSIRSRTERPVRVIPMVDAPVPEPRDRSNRPRTGFSFSRFLIPELAGYRGRAIYLDADMLVFDDIGELWDHPLGSNLIACTTQLTAPAAWSDDTWFHPGKQMSVMLLDCAGLDWKIDDIVDGLDDGRYTYADLLFDMCIVPADRIDGSLPEAWNHLERYEPQATKLLHFTVVPTQPWKNDRNPLASIWTDAFTRAVADGAVTRPEVERLVGKKLAKASLLELFDERAPRPRPPGSPLELELAATRARLTAVEARTLRGRIRRTLKRFGPLARQARGDGFPRRLGEAVERVTGDVRRRLS
jgi:hypothetical protein